MFRSFAALLLLPHQAAKIQVSIGHWLVLICCIRGHKPRNNGVRQNV